MWLVLSPTIIFSMRTALGIIIGYIIFVLTSLAFFNISGQKPHADATISFMLITAVYGIVTSFISGLIAQTIAGKKGMLVNYILTIIIAGFAAFSMFKANGNKWTQLEAICLFAPASVLGGWACFEKTIAIINPIS